MATESIEKEFDKKPIKTIIKYSIIAMLILLLLGIVGSLLGMFGKVVSAPSRVIDKTLNTNNIIQSYEWFYDVNAGYESRIGQIRDISSQEGISETDSISLRTELSAVKQSCRELVTEYNANSQKMNKQIFKGWTLPVTLNLETCDKGDYE